MNLWVDDPRNFTKSPYFAASDSVTPTIPHLRIRGINELAPRMESDSFYKNNPGLTDDYKMYIEREMIGSRNLAAASDLLRYEILRQEGGYYFDTDIKFKSTDNNFEADIPPHGFWVDYGSERNLKSKLINDIIACEAGHRVMELVIVKAIESYKDHDYLSVDSEAPLMLRPGKLIFMHTMDIKRYLKHENQETNESIEGRRHYTIELSGPGILRTAVHEYVKETWGKINALNNQETNARNKLLNEFLLPSISGIHHDTFNDRKLMGVTFTQKCDNTWLAKRKTGQPSFEDYHHERRNKSTLFGTSGSTSNNNEEEEKGNRTKPEKK